jgi:large subunit ribosomal protein L24
MNKLKKGDKVKVMRGKDAGKEGEIEKLIYKVDKQGKKVTKALIHGVNVVKRSQKPNPQFGIQGGIVEIEKPIDVSNVMLIDKKTGKPTRVGFKVDEKTGKKVRFAKKSGEVI